MHFGENQLSPGSIGISPLPTPPSPWTWVDHPASCLNPAAYRPGMNSLAHSSIGTRSATHGSPPVPCGRTVSGSISLPSPGFFSRLAKVFSLGGWSPLIPPGFLVSRCTWDHIPASLVHFAYRTFTFFGLPSHAVACCQPAPYVPTPKLQRLAAITQLRFGLFPVRSPLLRESLLISLPEATEATIFTKRCMAYPGLFAACHVLLRPLLPRHPPCALYILLHLLFPSTSYALVFLQWASNCSHTAYFIVPL